MRLNARGLKFLTKEELRVLIAVEMGSRNHEVVSTHLIGKIANHKRVDMKKTLGDLLRMKYIAHENKSYEGYKLTASGYDTLALTTFAKRGILQCVGSRIGVGKESDIHVAEMPNGRLVVLKLHRLGRTSFRNVKEKRDYLKHRQTSSWLYLSRLSAFKEFAYMKALYKEGFLVPEPIDCNRHAVVMEYIEGVPLCQVRHLEDPWNVMERLIQTVVDLACAGLIHSDFNEFNLMVSKNETITMIDFPQIISINHPNAEELFARDINGIVRYFRNKFSMETDPETLPKFCEVVTQELLAAAREKHKELKHTVEPRCAEDNCNREDSNNEEEISREEIDSEVETSREESDHEERNIGTAVPSYPHAAAAVNGILAASTVDGRKLVEAIVP